MSGGNNVPWFLNQPAPVNYVAGLGRGATGFTTRSDIGPARNIPELVTEDSNKPQETEEDENAIRGNNLENERLFAGTPYDRDDEEADLIWDAVDARMDSRRRERREQLKKKEIEKYRELRPKIQQSFADLKQELKTVSEEEWMNIPEIGDKSLARKNKKQETFTPVPDKFMMGGNQGQFSTTLNGRDQKYGGLATPLNGSTPITDLTQMGTARKTMLSMQLQSKADSVKGQTVTNPKGYLTDLNSKRISSDMEIGDIKRARLLLESVVKTNPNHGGAWIAVARLEEYAGKLNQARKLALKGCENAPDNEDVWLEAARLHNNDSAKMILAKAVKELPKSVKIWIQAAKYETDVKGKKKIFRRALEFIPNSEELWKMAVELEDPEDARILLSRAVECIPHCVDMWLALAQLETFENARKVLNTASKAVPTEPLIWINASKLEEAAGNADKCSKIIQRAIKSLANRQVVLTREAWLAEAEKSEESGSPVTCLAIVRETIGMGLEDADRKGRWMEDAEECIARKHYQTARAIYSHALTVFPNKKSIWLTYANLEKVHGTHESLMQVLDDAVTKFPQSEELWLRGAKELWLKGDIRGARERLKSAANNASINREVIWLAAIKLERENNEIVRARYICQKALADEMTRNKEKICLKSIKIEREIGLSTIDEATAEQSREAEFVLLEESLKIYPNSDKLWILRCQYAERVNDSSARNLFKTAVQNCPSSINLWLHSSRFEEKSSPAKARSLLERARLKNPKSPLLWLEAVRVETRAGNEAMANNIMAKALQDCPKSGPLWAEAINMEPIPKRKAKVLVALNTCDNDPYVMTAVAKVFWEERKVAKARSWFNRAITLEPNLGDSWAAFYKFEMQHGTEEQQKAVLNRCKESKPTQGEKWRLISKSIENSRLNTEEILRKVALIV